MAVLFSFGMSPANSMDQKVRAAVSVISKCWIQNHLHCTGFTGIQTRKPVGALLQ